MAQYINSYTGETVYRNPGEQLPSGPGVYQSVGTVSNPVQGGTTVPYPSTYSAPSPTSQAPLFGAAVNYSPPTPSYSHTRSGSVSGHSGPPPLTAYQFGMFLLGSIIGFVVGVVPFFIKGLGFYSSYPLIVGGETGFALGGLLCAYACVTKPRKKGAFKAIFKASLVLLATFTILHYAPFVPFVRLYKSLL